MKKFLTASLLLAIAGVALGIVRRQDAPATAMTVAGPANTTTTTGAVGVVPVTTATTVRAATKTTTIGRAATTSTTAPAIRAATTTTTVSALPTTTTTTTTAGPAPTCSIVPTSATVAPSEAQVLHLTSNLPNTSVKVTAIFPGDPMTANKIPRQYVHQATTDASGSDTWTVRNPDRAVGTVGVSVNFYPAGAKQIGSLCSTTYQAVA